MLPILQILHQYYKSKIINYFSPSFPDNISLGRL